MSGYSSDESEEMVARVISVMDSPQHFKEQTVNVLEEVCWMSYLTVSFFLSHSSPLSLPSSPAGEQ